MNIRIIQWNISYNANPEKIANYLLKHLDVYTIVNLQEVLEPTHLKLISILQPQSSAYSLELRKPGLYDGKNRKMGVATYVFGGDILKSEVLSRSIFPDRTLFCSINFENRIVSILNFHSLTGVDYKKAKSSNFASIAEYIINKEDNLDFFVCDANEPKIDSSDDDKIEFFDNKDKGLNAGLIFGKNKVHKLNDAYKKYINENGLQADTIPLAVSYVISKKLNKRYDHMYSSKSWMVNNVRYPYQDSIDASSDHSSVIGDFTFISNL